MKTITEFMFEKLIPLLLGIMLVVFFVGTFLFIIQFFVRALINN